VFRIEQHDTIPSSRSLVCDLIWKMAYRAGTHKKSRWNEVSRYRNFINTFVGDCIYMRFL
jgi:hypothetical protein